MFKEIREFHAFRVEDHQPLRGHQIAEAIDAGELVYIRWPDGQNVSLLDKAVRGCPQVMHSPRAGRTVEIQWQDALAKWLGSTPVAGT